MGNILCNCRKKNKKKIVLLLVGLDNAGKTAAAKGLAGDPTDSIVPTVGFSIINLKYLGYSVKIFDLGGGSNIRGIWHRYFVDAHGVIFVVDSSDLSRLDEARDVLKDLLTHEKISKKPVLVLANKQDNENALDEVDIIEKLELEKLVNGIQCPTLVETCSASSSSTKIDPGIKKGYDWILNYIMRNYPTLNMRVEADVQMQLESEQRLRMERIAQIRAEQSSAMQDEDAIESYSNYERKIQGIENEKDPDESGGAESVESFPSVFNVREDSILVERPNSIVHIVKQQLQLNGRNGHKPSFISKASNKTAPLFLYTGQRPSTAGAKSRTYDKQRRNLRSAGDVTTGDEFHQEIFRLVSRKCEVAPKEPNGLMAWVHKKPNGISVLEVDL